MKNPTTVMALPPREVKSTTDWMLKDEKAMSEERSEEEKMGV